TRIAAAASDRPVDAILALGDAPTEAAAMAAHVLGLRSNPPEAVARCRNKALQRAAMQAAHLPMPSFFSFATDEDLLAVASRILFPCVVKPLALAASQGVIRANNPQEFFAAVARIRALLESPPVQATRNRALGHLLVEDYIPGQEVAVEGLVTGGRLRVLAIFDKPDAGEGPFFEETIYVTPSRLPARVQSSIIECAQRTVGALGLTHGPVHAEFRVNNDGPWVLEAAPRPIGGLCSRALRFGPQRIALEELVVRRALGEDVAHLQREPDASGVMMIPVPRSGIFEKVEGIDDAARTPGVWSVEITARLHDPILAWPEGSSYLGFIFARGDRPEDVELALRSAHSKLGFTITPELPVEHPQTKKGS
ncbi:MAG TPA: ATP-grasp domain-containing protein, partial [Candidatus Acidoferrales bacterium]